MWNEDEKVFIASDDTDYDPTFNVTDVLSDEEIIEARKSINEIFNNYIASKRIDGIWCQVSLVRIKYIIF